MTSRQLWRCAGVITIIAAGIVGLLVTLIDLAVAGVVPGGFVTVTTVAIVTLPVLLLSIAAVFVWHAPQAGWPGAISTLLLFFGAALTIAVMGQQQVMSSRGETIIEVTVAPPLALVQAASGILLFVGWVMFGLMMWRANAVPRWAAALVAIGFVLGVPLRMPFPGGRSIGFWLFALGYGAVGLWMWQHPKPLPWN